MIQGPPKVLEDQERERRNSLKQRWHFSPLVASTEGLLGKESQTLLKKLSAHKPLLKKLSTLLTKKWEKPYSEICGYVNAQMSIAMV
jgi:hypothetical protein